MKTSIETKNRQKKITQKHDNLSHLLFPYLQHMRDYGLKHKEI